MLRLPSKLLLLILFCVTSAHGAEMLVHGNDQAMWIAIVTDAPKGEKGLKTRIRMRSFGGDQAWRELTPLSGRVIALASRGQVLAALLDSGDWLLTYSGGDSVGPALPTRQKIQYLASEKDTLYAIAPKGRLRVSTTTSTAPIITTLPSTNESDVDASKLELYRLDKSSWEKVADLPDDLPKPEMRLRLCVIQGKPMLAIADKGNVIRVIEVDAAGQWIEKGSITSTVDTSHFELLNIESQPAVWVADSTGPGKLHYWRGSAFAPPVELSLKSTLDSKSLRDAVYAKGNIREVVLADPKLLEQCFRADGSRSSDLTELTAPRANVAPVSSFPQWLLMVGLAALILASLKRTDVETPIALQSGTVRLAPLGTRVLAALIDLTPFLAAGIYLQLTVTQGTATSEDFALPIILATAIYFIHTTLLEVLTTRSVGKFICGLKVVTLDGGRPSVSSLLIRNVMRAVDMFPLFPLAIMISFTPLRQRVGDVTAKTIVITTREPEKDEEPVESAE